MAEVSSSSSPILRLPLSLLPLPFAAATTGFVEFDRVLFVLLSPIDNTDASISIRHSTRLTSSADKSLEKILAVTLNLLFNRIICLI